MRRSFTRREHHENNVQLIDDTKQCRNISLTMKNAIFVPGVLSILLFIKFGSCGTPGTQACDEDRHPKIFGLLGVLTGVHLTPKFNLHAAQYNFFGSDWSSLGVGISHNVPSSTSLFAEYYHHHGHEEPNNNHDEHESHFSHGSLQRKYGRELKKELNANDLLAANDHQPNDSVGRLVREVSSEEATSTMDDSMIDESMDKSTIDDSSDATTTIDSASTDATDTTSSISVPTTAARPELSSAPTDSYGPPPSGLPAWSITLPTAPYPSYGPPTIPPANDYGHSKTRDVHDISISIPPNGYHHHNYHHGYHHDYHQNYLHPYSQYYPYYNPYTNYYVHYNPYYPNSAFKPSYPDHFRNSWDPHNNYFVPIAAYNG